MNCDQQELKQLPLHSLHEEAGAKFAPFAGWLMPLTYPAGVMKEHLFTREHAGLFDISHMQLVKVEGEEAAEFLQYALPIEPEKLALNQCRYSLLLDEKAHILDDLIVTRLSLSSFMLAVNAGNAQQDIAELRRRMVGFSCQLLPLERVFLALQGPEAAAVLRDAGLPGNDLLFMQGFETKEGMFVTRSGYTGEDGFEIAVPVAKGAQIAQALLGDSRVMWIGLAARDSLRLEAGLCLHGADITASDNPVEAGLSWAITKGARASKKFVGAEAFLSALEAGAKRRRVGLAGQTRQPVRAGALLCAEDGQEIGRVTSGGFGPSFNGAVAMGYLASEFAQEGQKVFAKLRDKLIELHVHKLPFVLQRYFKG